MNTKIVSLKKDEIQELLKTSNSINQILKKLNVNSNGSGAYKTFKNHCKNLGIEIPIYRPIGRKNGNFNPINLTEILVENSTFQNMSRLKKKLINAGLLKYKCLKCNISTWNDEYISLHIDHINGIHNDNRIENLRLLCPNCHSQTETYGAKNKSYKKIKKIKEKKFIQKHKNNKIKVSKSQYKRKRKVEDRPSLEVLKNEIRQFGYTGTGRKYGVSDNAVRKWLKYYNK